MISGVELNYRNGLAGIRGLGITIALLNPPHFSIECICLDSRALYEQRVRSSCLLFAV